MAKRDSNSDPLSTNPDPSSSANSTVQQVKDQAKSLAHDAKEEVSNVAGQARSQVQGLVTQQKDRVADQLGSLAGALRDTGNQLGQKLADKPGSNNLDLGRYAGQAAERVDRISNYLRGHELGDVIRDAETFARRRPDVFLGGTFLAGLLLARFLKASGNAESLETGAVRAGQSAPRTGGTPLRTGTSGTGSTSGTYGRTGEPAYQAPRPYTPPVGG
jgi:gas vesicle protein